MAIILSGDNKVAHISVVTTSSMLSNPLQAGIKLSLQHPTTSLIDVVLPARNAHWNLVQDTILVVAFVAFTALMARISIPLWFTPIPLTGQTLAVLLTGAALGSRRGSISMATYLVAGFWLPIYAGGGSGLFWESAAGGYIVGFIPAAYAVGFLCERGWDRRVLVILAMLLGNILLYVPGLIQLSMFVGIESTLEKGLYPFIPGDLIKLFIASLALPTGWKLVNWVKGIS